MRNKVWAFLLFSLSTLLCPATTPNGGDNQGGVSCPAGSFSETPVVPSVALNPYTGNATRVVNDLSVSSISEVGLNFTRYCNSRGNAGTSAMGNVGGWRHSYQWDLIKNANGSIQLVYPNGMLCLFTQTSTNVWTSTSSVTDVITPQGTGFILTTSSNVKYNFSYGTIALIGSSYYLSSIVDSKGLTTTLIYTNNGTNGVNVSSETTKVTEPGGRSISIVYGSHITYWNNRNGLVSFFVNSVSSSDGRSATYTYGESSFTYGTTTYSYALSQVAYSGTTSASYGYATIVAPNVSTTENGVYALSQAIDSRAQGISNIKYTYFAGATSGIVQTVSEGLSNSLICTLSLQGGNVQTPQVTFPDGSSFKYTVNSGGQLASVTNSLGQVQSYAYATGTGTFTTTTTSANGNVSSVTRTTNGKLTSHTLPPTGLQTVGPTEHWYYNTAGYLTSFADAKGNTTTLTRNTSNLITSVAYPDSTSESYTYNSFGEILTHTRRNGGVEYFTYDTTGLLLTQRTAAESVTQVTTLAYNSNYRLASSTDANGHATSFQYNDAGQTTLVTNPDGSTRSYVYGPNLLTSTTNELGKTWSKTYDGLGRTLTSTDPLNRVTTYSYDGNTPLNSSPILTTLPGGKQIGTTYVAGWTYQPSSVTSGYGTSDAATTSSTYDNDGNQITTTDARGSVTQVAYDARDRKQWVQDPAGNVTHFYYDDDNNLISAVSPDGTSQNTYDVMNRLTQTSDPKNQVVSMTYDSEGSLHTYVDPGSNTYTYLHDLDERQTSMQYPDSTTETYAYDPVSNMTSYTTRDGKIETLAYDNRNRNTSTSWNDGVTPAVSKSYDAANRLTASSNSNSALSYTYDAANQTLTETQNITGLGSKTVTYSPNTDGTLGTLTYPDDTVLTYGYNNRNEVVSIQDENDTLATYSYDANGNRTGKTLGDGTTSTLTYDLDERLTSISDLTPSPNAGTPLQRFDYAYDAMNRRKYVKRDGALGDVYTYDTAGQLTNVQYNATDPDTTPTSPSKTVSYALDAAGNRTSAVDSSSGTITYVPNANNQYTSVGGQALTYDGRGNLETNNGWTYTYDAQNHLTEATNGITTTTFSYDPAGRCVERNEDGTSTYLVYDLGWKLLADFDSSGSQLYRYIGGVGADELISRTDSSDDTIYFHTDGLGSVTKLTNSLGAILEQYNYDVFGAVTIKGPSGTTLSETAYGNRFMFAGREYLTSLGLLDCRNRIYSPEIGRFLQPDPAGHSGDGYNLNRYCHNDPVNHTDPYGLGSHGEDASGLGDGYSIETSESYDIMSAQFAAYKPPAGQLDQPENFPPPIDLSGGGSETLWSQNMGIASAGGSGHGILSGIQAALNIVGVIPGIGEFANGANALISLSQGDYVAAGASAFALIPIVGVLGDIGNIARAGRGVEKAAEEGTGAARTLFHYTNEEGLNGILGSGELRPSLRSVNPNDVRYGNGQYLSDIIPGSKTPAQLSRAFLGNPFQGAKYTHYIEIDVSGLNVIQGRAGVFVIPNEGALNLSGRIISSGKY